MHHYRSRLIPFLASASALLLFDSPSHACDPRKADSREALARADTVLVAYVTGEHYPKFEAEVLSGEDPELALHGKNRTLRLVIVEVRRGRTEEKIMEIPVACGPSVLAVFDRVIVAIDPAGVPSVWDANDEEALGPRWFGRQ